MKCKECPYWYETWNGEEATYCHYPVDSPYPAPCEEKDDYED